MSLKKWIVLFVGIALAFSLAACGSSQQAESNATADSETIQESSPEPGTAEHSGDATSEPEVANEIVVFYGSNSWAYTRLGRITDKTAAEMADLLGNGNVTITISFGGK